MNKQIALRHIASGEMRPMGLAAVEAAKASGEWDRAYTVQPPPSDPGRPEGAPEGEPGGARAAAPRVEHTRWDRWLAWLDGSEGRARTRRLNMIVAALETKDYEKVDAAAAKRSA